MSNIQAFLNKIFLPGVSTQPAEDELNYNEGNYNEGWDEIVNHLLDEVGIKRLTRNTVTSGDFNTGMSCWCETTVIFNNDFEVRYDDTFYYRAAPKEERLYDELFTLSKRTLQKLEERIKEAERKEEKELQEKTNKQMAEKSEFIKKFYKENYE